MVGYGGRHSDNQEQERSDSDTFSFLTMFQVRLIDRVHREQHR